MRYIFILIVFCSCHVARKYSIFDSKQLTKESIIYYYENENLDSSLLIKRTDTNDVILSFFGTYDDTAAVYVNNEERFTQLIRRTAGMPTSTSNTGVKVAIQFSKSVSKVINIVLKRQKKFVSIEIDKSYPLCAIYRLEGKWYASFRKQVMIIK
jgi:hypothetical protein